MKTKATPEQKAQLAATLASNLVKKMGGNRVAQDAAALYAKESVLDHYTGATAVENGYRVGMGLKLLIN